MNLWITYLIKRFFYRIADFFRRWYVHGSHGYYDFVINVLRGMDYTLAWRITAKNILEPLYGDYSVIGHIIGFIVRIIRLCIATAIYAVVFAIAIAVYAVWLAIPPFFIITMFF